MISENAAFRRHKRRKLLLRLYRGIGRREERKQLRLRRLGDRFEHAMGRWGMHVGKREGERERNNKA